MTRLRIKSDMEEAEPTVIDLESICRLCLQEKRILMDIFESSEDNIEQKIKACATVDLCKNDGLPTRICIPCLSSLNAAFDFRIQCENADKTLRDIYHQLINEEVKKENAIVKLNDTRNLDVESKEQAVQYNDLNHIIVIKENEYNGNDSDNEEKQQKADDYLYLINKNEDLNKRVIVDDIIRVEENEVISSDSLTVLSTQTKEIKKSNSVERKATLDEDKRKESKKTRTHEDAKKSACPFCNKMLTRVNEHIRLLHQNKVYICKKLDCGAEFLTLKNLQSHQLKCYNMEKPYKCLRCYKEFYRKCNYKAHVIRHSNKKDFQCQLCDKAFVDSTGLRRHFLKHHELLQETFISNCCGKKFKTKEGLKQHIQKGICGIQVFQVLHSTDDII